MSDGPIKVVIDEPDPKPAAEPVKEAPEADPYDSIDEDIRQPVRQANQMLDQMDREQRAQVVAMAQAYEQEQIRKAERDALGRGKPAPTEVPKPEKKDAKPSDELQQRVGNVEALLLEERKVRMDKDAAEAEKAKENELYGVINAGLDSHEIDFEPAREEVTEQFLGHLMRLPRNQRPSDQRSYKTAFKKFMAAKEARAIDAEKAGKSEFVAAKYRAAKATKTETASGVSPTQREATISLKDARNPRKVAALLKERRASRQRG